ncbi:MAG TPA: PAS domain S-box protein [Pseudomonadales bacterium]|nr:PAS domain S-box protein [Pseudomonadales bacterium]
MNRFDAREGDAFYRGLVAMGLDVVTVLDEAGTIIFESPSVRTVFGHEPEALVGRPVGDLIHPEDRPRTLATIGEMLAGALQTETVEIRFHHADGRWCWIEAVARRWLFDGRVHVLVNSRDVTARREMFTELARSNELLTKTLRASRNVVSITSRDGGRFHEVNDEWLRVSGFEREEVIGRTADELGIWGDGVERARVIEDLRRSDGHMSDYEVTTHTRNGPRQLLINVEPLEIGDEPLILMIGSDVTEARLTEEQLRQSQKMEALGQLTGGVAHDFNNLLGVIMGNAELLGLKMPDDPELAAIVDVILQATERGATVTGQLLAFSRRQHLSPRPVPLTATLEDMLPLLRSTLGPGIVLDVDGAAGSPQALVDPGQLQNALLNLVVNARDAMPDGGTLTIELAREAVGAGDEELDAGDYVTLTVADTGVGIRAEELGRVFEPFYTTKEIGRGTGLGLSMVFGFATQSKGCVRVVSALGQGTRVTLWLPAAPAPENRLASDIRAEPPLGAGETVVVLEDESELLILMRRQLLALGYRVHEAENEAALRALLAAGTPFDMILSDVFLSGPRRGPELVAELLEQRPGTAVLYVSGYPADALGGALERASIDAPLLSKPFTRERLARAVRDALDRRPAPSP